MKYILSHHSTVFISEKYITKQNIFNSKHSPKIKFREYPTQNT